MARTLYLECNMGAAGDMLTAALYELLSEEEKKDFLHLVNEHGLPGVETVPEASTKCGVVGTHMCVKIHGEEECTEDVGLNGESHGDHEHDHEHEHHHNHDHGAHEHSHHHEHEHQHEHEHEHDHEHNHGHSHHHASLADVHAMIDACDLPDQVKKNACQVYDLLAKAESHAHGVEVSEIHFHEVGMKDAIADVLNVCLLLDMLKPSEVIVSPINTGFGQVRCAHGILPVPAPATAYLLQGAPTYSGNIQGEMCTPTGAALLQFVKTRFDKQPIMITEKMGYGMGKKDFPQANCVRAFIGNTDYDGQSAKNLENTATQENPETLTDCHIGAVKQIAELSCNLDDMTGEALGFAANMLRDAGALEVYITAVQMKKDRPGHLLTCLCKAEQADEMAVLILKYTTSWGVRKQYFDRYILERHTEERETPYGTIRLRCGSGYGIEKWKPEYEDVAEAAKKHCVTLKQVIDSIQY